MPFLTPAKRLVSLLEPAAMPHRARIAVSALALSLVCCNNGNKPIADAAIRGEMDRQALAWNRPELRERVAHVNAEWRAVLSDALAELLADPAKARAFGEAGRAFAEEHYSARRVIPSVEGWYRELLADARR